jgi:hypothetical protein
MRLQLCIDVDGPLGDLCVFVRREWNANLPSLGGVAKGAERRDLEIQQAVANLNSQVSHGVPVGF